MVKSKTEGSEDISSSPVRGSGHFGHNSGAGDTEKWRNLGCILQDLLVAQKSEREREPWEEMRFRS